MQFCVGKVRSSLANEKSKSDKVIRKKSQARTYQKKRSAKGDIFAGTIYQR